MPGDILRGLRDADLMLPTYLSPAVERLCKLSQPLSVAVKDFLNRPVTVAAPVCKRGMPQIANDADDDHIRLDIHQVENAPALRLSFHRDTIRLAAKVLFGGQVEEPALQQTICEAFAVKIGTVLLSAIPFGSNAPHPVAAKPTPLSTAPVLKISFSIELADEAEPLTFEIEAARAFTDLIAPPPPCISHDLLESFPMRVTAVLAEAQIPIARARQLKPDDVLQLPQASVDHVRLTVQTPRKQLSLAAGEMGKEYGSRSIRLTQIAGKEGLNRPVAKPSSPPKESSASQQQTSDAPPKVARAG